MVAVADQGLMPLAAEQGKAVGVDVVSELWQLRQTRRLRLGTRRSGPR